MIVLTISVVGVSSGRSSTDGGDSRDESNNDGVDEHGENVVDGGEVEQD